MNGSSFDKCYCGNLEYEKFTYPVVLEAQGNENQCLNKSCGWFEGRKVGRGT